MNQRPVLSCIKPLCQPPCYGRAPGGDYGRARGAFSSSLLSRERFRRRDFGQYRNSDNHWRSKGVHSGTDHHRASKMRWRLSSWWTSFATKTTAISIICRAG